MTRKLSLCCISNNDTVLKENLLAHCHAAAIETLIEKSPASAAIGLNALLEKAVGDVIILAHQDLYLPQNWFEQLSATLDWLDKNDPKWGVLGAWGRLGSEYRGHIYTTGLRRLLGKSFELPLPVDTLDEVLLIINAKAGLQFDANLEGFHLYGSDICLTAKAKGFNNYVIDAFALHNSNGLKTLPRDFWTCYRQMKRKWAKQLPIKASCITISKSRLHYWNQRLRYWRLNKISNPGSRVNTPRDLFETLKTNR